jgi:hypothetical protein
VWCSYECKLCLTLHNNEGNYLAHTQGKRHENNLAKHAAREAKDAPAQPQPNKRKVNPHKAVKIGRPGYHVTKQYDQESRQRSLLFQVQFLSTFYDVQKVAFMCHLRSSTQRLNMDPNLTINLCLLMNRYLVLD